MEYCDGGSLEDKLEWGKFKESDAITMIKQIIEGL